jgi:hypothetical protein
MWLELPPPTRYLEERKHNGPKECEERIMAAIRLNLLSLAILLLIYGLVYENHEVVSLHGAIPVAVSGPTLIEASTWEAFALYQDKLVSEYPPSDTFTSPESASLVPWVLQQKDCKT